MHADAHTCMHPYTCLYKQLSSNVFPILEAVITSVSQNRPFLCPLIVRTLGTAVMWLKEKTAPPYPASVIIMHCVCLYILFGKYKNQIEENKRLRQTASFPWAEPGGTQNGGQPLQCHPFFHLLRERGPASCLGVPDGATLPVPLSGIPQAKNGRPAEEGARLAVSWLSQPRVLNERSRLPSHGPSKRPPHE